jgi:hypothetical protein
LNSLPVDRALSIYGALADRSETKGAREGLSKHLMKIYTEGEKETPIDGAWTIVPSQARSRTRLQKLSVLIVEGRVVLSPSKLPAAFAGNFAALFPLLRRGLLPPLLVVFSVAAPSFALRPLASKAALVSPLSSRARWVAFSLGRWRLVCFWAS